MQILLKRLIQFDIREFFYKAYLKMILVSLAVLPIFLIKNMLEPSLLRFVVITSISVLWLLAMIYIFGMEKKEKEMVSLTLKKIYSR
jgi:hypothetical protein